MIARLKVLKPVYTVERICEDAAPYLRQQVVSSEGVYKLFEHLSEDSRESFLCLHLNAKHKIIAVDYVSQGSMTASIVHPRELFSAALLSTAAAVIFVHNHPSGDPEPSPEDHKLTKRLKECADLLGIQALDHIVIGEGRYVSFADRGLLQ